MKGSTESARDPGGSLGRARLQVDELRRKADAITSRLLYSDEPYIDLRIAMDALREEVRQQPGDRSWLFEIVYVARWQRLREQGWARSGA